MAITSWPTLTDDDGTGTTGTLLNNTQHQADKTALEAWVTGWTQVAFAAGNFTGSGSMTWTVASGDVAHNRYQLVDKGLYWQLALQTTTVGGTPSTALRVATPTGTFASTASICKVAYCLDNNVVREAYAQVLSASLLGIFRQDGANWTASTDLTSVSLQGFFELA